MDVTSGVTGPPVSVACAEPVKIGKKIRRPEADEHRECQRDGDAAIEQAIAVRR